MYLLRPNSNEQQKLRDRVHESLRRGMIRELQYRII